jgi:hypothetical protein
METETTAALIGGVIGGVLTIAGNLIHEWWRDRRNSRQLSHAIAGEVGALVRILERRRYLETIKDYAQRARQGEIAVFDGRISKNYFPVIEASLDQIGTLPGELPILIPELLTLAKSALEDLEAIEAGEWSDRDAEGYATGYDELAEVLESGLDAGRSIVVAVARVYGSPH